MSTLKQRYKRFNRREKTLMVLIAWTLVILWGSTFISKGKLLAGRLSSANGMLAQQELDLSERAEVEAKLINKVATLDEKRTLSDTLLSAKVETLARAKGLKKFTAKQPETEIKGDMKLHRMTLTVREAELAKLMDFDKALNQSAPYITLEAVNFVPERGNGSTLKATFVISSFEIMNAAVPGAAN